MHIRTPLFICILFFILLINSEAAEHARRTSILVSADWLIDHFNDPDLVIFHVGGKKSFDSAHIPGAQYLSLRELMVMEAASGLLHEIPPAAQVAGHLKELGVTDSSRIVLYHEEEGLLPSTARIFMTLDVLGIGKSVAILDGGFQQWNSLDNTPQEKRSISKPGTLTAHPKDDVLVDTKWLSENFSRPGIFVIDARPEDHYLGKSNPHDFPREGHIKGSFNIPFYSLVKEDAPHLFKAPEELRAIFADNGIQDGGIVVAYCNTGFWAAQVYFIARYLGYDVRFYDPAFQEWSADEKLPVIGPADIGL